ncbi:MAG: hypothetical protein ACE5JG_03795 [Planctomycetota bacterium]
MPSGGHVYVALSNGAGSAAGLSRFHPGTVQAGRVDFPASEPVSPETAGKAVADRTLTHVSGFYNPVALTRYVTPRGDDYLILTDAGASRFDASFVLQPTTDAFLEVLDLHAGRFQSGPAVNVGAVLPSVHAIAVGRDATGRSYGLLTSQTLEAVFAVDLSGLDTIPADPSRLGLLRVFDLSPGGSATAGSGFQPDVVIRPGGAFAVVSSFSRSRLEVLSLPDDLAAGAVEVNPPPFDGLQRGTTRGFGLGAIVSVPGPGPEIFAVVNGNFSPARNSFLGSLNTGGALP